MKESAFERKCVKLLQKLPNSYWPPKGAPGAILGSADRTGCVSGRYISLEFKKNFKEVIKKTKRSALQHYTIECVRKAGGVAMFIYPENWDVMHVFLKGLSNANK